MIVLTGSDSEPVRVAAWAIVHVKAAPNGAGAEITVSGRDQIVRVKELPEVVEQKRDARLTEWIEDVAEHVSILLAERPLRAT